jgi:hypothetical protein
MILNPNNPWQNRVFPPVADLNKDSLLNVADIITLLPIME